MGNFHASYWEKDHVSKKYGSLADTPYSKTVLGGNAFGPYQLHLAELESRGIYIHGTMGPSWNPSTTLNALVSPTSHGCIRMANTDNIKLHEMTLHPGQIPVAIKKK
jgi:lipoprotein-anchoring transpeptidase ErfK/SrfK